jgi:hypothetical protein
MADKPGMKDAADRLYDILNEYDVHSSILETRFPEFDAETKRAVVLRVGAMFDPPPPGPLLARLLYILTDTNRQDLVRVYIANLRSPDQKARKFSLYGLSELKHPSVREFAIAALRDESDDVVMQACAILLPEAQQDRALWKLLQGVYRAHEGQPGFHSTTSLLTSSGIERDEPPSA